MGRTEEVLGGMSGGDQVISKALNEADHERENLRSGSLDGHWLFESVVTRSCVYISSFFTNRISLWQSWKAFHSVYKDGGWHLQ